MIKFALPVKNGKLDSHFGHAALFAIIEVDESTGDIQKITPVTPPPHAPGVIPDWIASQGVTVVIANKMGDKAKAMLAKLNIETLTDIVPAAPDELVKMYFAKTLVTAPAQSCCGHDHGHTGCHSHEGKTGCHKHGHEHEHDEHEHDEHKHDEHKHDEHKHDEHKHGNCHGGCRH